jgi:hypothetical protein
MENRKQRDEIWTYINITDETLALKLHRDREKALGILTLAIELQTS